MTGRYLRLSEVCEQFAIDDDLLRIVEAEHLIEIEHPANAEPQVSAEQAERLRLITVLMRELEVNVAGVEVILHMHEDLCAMQRDFHEILQAVAAEMRRRVAG